MDTSPDAPGAGVEPIVHRDYDGSPIELPRGGTVGRGRPPGHDIVTASGDTLLGADDKAGVAEIMAAVAYLAAHPECPRPTLRVCFTPDEEIGEGATLFDVERFGAVCAYTLDGSDLGELQDETFSAEEVVVTIHGVDAHPGWATGVLVERRPAGGRDPRRAPRRAHARDARRAATASSTPTRSRARPAAPSSARSCATSTTTSSPRTPRCCAARPRRSSAASPTARLEVEVTPQYPNMRRYLDEFPRAVGSGRGGDPRRGPRGRAHADPRRHRRLTPERDGPADAEPVHGRA